MPAEQASSNHAEPVQHQTQRAAREARWRAVWQSRQWPSWGWWPVSVVYGTLASLQRLLYRTGLKRSACLPCPVLVVGNVIAGGAGKTPTTIALVQHFQQQGIRVGIVSRGHGRSGQGCMAVTPHSLACDVGDEPLLMWRRTGAPVFVANARAQAGLALLHAHPDTQLIVCDDALQHLALAHDWSLCVFDERGTGNGWLLPAGPLREPWPRPVDWAIQIRDADPTLPPASIKPVHKAWPATRTLSPFAVDANGQRVELRTLAEAGHPLAALAGIAKPEVFFTALQRQGLPVSQCLPLADHAPITAHWLAQALPHGVATFGPSQTEGAPPHAKAPLLLCTEKDAVKLWPICPQALAVPLHVQLPIDLLDAITHDVTKRLKR